MTASPDHAGEARETDDRAPLFVEHRMDGVSALDASGAVLWRRPGGIVVSHAVLPDALVVAFYGGPVLALSPQTGEVLWRHEISATHLTAARGRVILAGYELACLDDGGKIVWKVEPPYIGDVPEVHVVEDLAVLASNGVEAYQERDGAPMWSAAPGPPCGDDLEDPRWTGLWEASIVERGGVLFGTAYSAAFALDARSGRTRFHRRFATTLHQMATPVLAGDTMLCATVHGAEGFLEALDAEDGAPRWRLDLPWCDGASMTAIGSTTILPLYREIVGVDLARGAVAWRKAWAAPFWQGQVVGDRLLISSGGLHMLDPRDGSFVWSAPEDHHLASMFALTRGDAVFTPARSEVIARRLEDGAELWRTEVPGVGADYLLRVFA